MKKITFFCLVFGFLFFTAGCSVLPNISNSSQSPANATSSKNAVPPRVNTNKAAPVNSTKTADTIVKKFYPEDSGLVKKETTSASPATGGTLPSGDVQNFVVTQELEVKMYLVDKYAPGVCYGLPTSLPDSVIKSMLANNYALAQFLKNKYQLTTDPDIYNKIKQLNGIMLSSASGGTYSFSFMDGQCCTLNYYSGKITIVGHTISESGTKEASKTNPC